MEILEFFKERYIQESTSERPLIKVSDTVEKGSLRYITIWFDYVCGGTYDYRLKEAGITPEQIKDARDKGFLGYRYYSNWEARMRGNTNYYFITRKGIKELYKQYKGQL